MTDTKSIVWKYAKGTAYVPLADLLRRILLSTTDRGVLTCLDANTGEVKYEGVARPSRDLHASPSAYDGRSC